MPDLLAAVDIQTERQVAHWTLAAARLDLDELASAEAWARLERYLGIALRRHLQGVIDRLASDARVLTTLQREARSLTAHAEVRQRLLAFRARYLRAETTLDFFADAINVRTNLQTGALLRACDTLAHRSMSQLLEQVGKTAPVSLTYVDKGLGASILKAGLRLWDGGDANPVAVIKITRHNLLRPTALIHEAGHQVAHICGWTSELATAFARGLPRVGASSELANIWAGWTSEIAADAFAFVHTGFASVAALHDVLAGDAAGAFRHIAGDPHPISHLRVLLAVQMCRHCYGGSGPWEGLALAWTHLHPLDRANAEVRAIVQDSMAVLDAVVRLVLDAPMQAFGGRALRALIAPERVSPAALAELEGRIGPALFTSAHWLWAEPLRILGLTGLQLAQSPDRLASILDLQQQSMLRLGGALQAA